MSECKLRRTTDSKVCFYCKFLHGYIKKCNYECDCKRPTTKNLFIPTFLHKRCFNKYHSNKSARCWALLSTEDKVVILYDSIGNVVNKIPFGKIPPIYLLMDLDGKLNEINFPYAFKENRYLLHLSSNIIYHFYPPYVPTEESFLRSLMDCFMIVGGGEKFLELEERKKEIKQND